MSINNAISWTFYEQTAIPPYIQELLIDGEHADQAYKTIRDIAVFTNKRLIVSDSQGFSGKKKEIYSLPYSSINMWSTENAGTFDLDAEVQLWTRAGNIKISLRRGIDIRYFDTLLAQYIL